MPVDFFGPDLKVERADHHISQLETIFGRFVHDNTKRLAPDRKYRRLKGGQSAATSTFPRHTATVLGDAVHNLHAALDHAYHIVAEANQAIFSDRRLFPFGKDRQSLEGSINGHKQKGTTPSDKVIAAILDEIQPYEKGKLGLYGLHQLDITDKHIVLIPTVTVTAVDRMDFVDDTGAKTGGRIEGITFVGTNQRERGQPITFAGGSGAILSGDPKDTFLICFDRGQPFEGESILATVRSMKSAVVEALDILRKAAG